MKSKYLKKLMEYERITNGLICMLYGYFMKMVIADRVSIMVDQVFETIQYLNYPK